MHSVQRAVADAVGAVAKLTLPQQQWSELLGFLYDCSRSGNAGARETALLLFGSLAESIGGIMLADDLARTLQPVRVLCPFSDIGGVLAKTFQACSHGVL